MAVPMSARCPDCPTGTVTNGTIVVPCCGGEFDCEDFIDGANCDTCGAQFSPLYEWDPSDFMETLPTGKGGRVMERPPEDAHPPFLERLAVLARDWRYSDEFIGIMVRANIEHLPPSTGKDDQT